MPTTKEIKKKLLTTTDRREKKLQGKDLLSIGSTLVNLLCTHRTTGAIPKGTYVHIVGDSDSGKTMTGMTLFAEAARNKEFDEYRLIFGNSEGGALMDWAEYFGSKAEARIEEEQPEDLEDFYYRVDNAVKDGRKFIWVQDSMDVLYPRAWLKKFNQNKNKARKGEEEAGDYGMAKAKVNSENLRRLRTILRKTGSILIILSQTRDKVQKFGFGDPKTVSGGHVLKFYAVLQIWMSTQENITRTVMGKKRSIGITSCVWVKKNHVTGFKGKVAVDILNDSGIDDVGSCIDYLVEEGYWKTGEKGRIKATEFSEDPVSREKLVRLIERDGEEKELRMLVKQTWDTIREGCKSNRKKRYE